MESFDLICQNIPLLFHECILLFIRYINAEFNEEIVYVWLSLVSVYIKIRNVSRRICDIHQDNLKVVGTVITRQLKSLYFLLMEHPLATNNDSLSSNIFQLQTEISRLYEKCALSISTCNLILATKCHVEINIQCVQ